MVNVNKCKLLVLTCIDFRLPDHITAFLNQQGYNRDYDLNTLPGASLGPCCESYPHWRQTFANIIEIAQKLHDIQKIMIIDHHDCGAYHTFVNQPENDDHEKELHTTVSKKTLDWLKEAYPELDVEIFYYQNDGSFIKLHNHEAKS